MDTDMDAFAGDTAHFIHMAMTFVLLLAVAFFRWRP